MTNSPQEAEDAETVNTLTIWLCVFCLIAGTLGVAWGMLG